MVLYELIPLFEYENIKTTLRSLNLEKKLYGYCF